MWREGIPSGWRGSPQLESGRQNRCLLYAIPVEHFLCPAPLPSPVPPSAMPQVIDHQMEQLATGAAKALGSLWGGLATSVLKVEAATMGLAEKLVDTLEEGAQNLAKGPALAAAKGTLQVRCCAKGAVLMCLW